MGGKMNKEFKPGQMVKIIEGSIEKGLLKEICKKLMGRGGIVYKSSIGCSEDEVSVNFGDGYDAWIMPKECLEIVDSQEIEKLKKRLLWKGTQLDINSLAEFMHDRYEKHSIKRNWETQKSCKQKPFENLPEENQEVMKDLAVDMLIWREEYVLNLKGEGNK